MGLVVVGTVGIDDIETPFDRVTNVLGGSSVYNSLAASYFSDSVHLIGVAGDDLHEDHINLLKKHKIDLEGLEIVNGGKTFRWSGKYHYDLNIRDTIFTQLNVLEKFNPVIPEKCKSSEFVLLGNIDPALQLNVLDQMEKPRLSVCDTMNFWITGKREELLKLIKRIDVLIFNESEARLLTKEPNLIKAAKMVQDMGPKNIVIMKGEHGALLFAEDRMFSAPAYPLEDIHDPTGAGDSFAGGFTGYLHKTKDLSFDNLKRAVIYGSTMASFCVEKFSTAALENLTSSQIYDRFLEFRNLSDFKSGPDGI